MRDKFEDTNYLIERCLKGDEKAFEFLYKNYYGLLMSVCSRYARDNEEAKDIFHNAFMKIVQNLSKFTFKGTLEAWLKKVSINEAINYYNRVNKKNQVDYKETNLEFEDQHNVVSEKIIFEQFEIEELKRMIAELPDSYRFVFNLYAIEGYSHKEVAEKLSIKESTSKSNLSRARVILKEKLLQIEEYEKENVKKLNR